MKRSLGGSGGARPSEFASVAALAVAACLVASGCTPATAAASATAATSTFTLTSEAVADGRLLPAFRCEPKVGGVEASIPLAWSNVPAGTRSLAVVMRHYPVPSDTTQVSSYLLLWDIDPSVTSISHGGADDGPWHMGANKDGTAVSYTSPCSQGAGAHEYTITLYALASRPASLPDRSTVDVTYEVLTKAIDTVGDLGTAKLTFTDPGSAPGSTGTGPAPSGQPGAVQPPPPPGGGQPAGGGQPSGTGYTIEQAISDKAQSTTIAFDALGFLTGNLSSDSFFPPGKVADFWGFQYLRDNDPTEMGHNTDFLTSASLTMLKLLTAEQRASLASLAKSQVASINDYGYRRFVLMKAFRRLLEGDLPTGTTGLSEAAVKAYSAELYALDGKISLERAQVMGPMLASLTTAQRATLDAMKGTGMKTWPAVTEPDDLRGLSRDEKVAVMTYAGDMFSWYVGSVEADTYFCPERHGTYFGSFYLKDAPAVGNPGYSIGTTITADLGATLISKLDATQAASIGGLVDSQRSALAKIVETRRAVSTELRKLLSGRTVDAAAVAALMKTYGELDGAIVYQYANAFVSVGRTLSDAQKADLRAMRKTLLGDLSEPTSAFLFSQPIPMPTIPDTDFLFGSGGTSGTPPTTVAAVPALRIARGSAAALTSGYGTATSVTNGGRITLKVTLAPAVADAVVRLYQRTGPTGTWSSVATGRTGAAGTVTWSRTVRAPSAATGTGRSVYFRVSAPGATTGAVTWSRLVRAVVR
jgi:phosphatidylethanolamine-binding protein (PEBP) family uncharacterized protein/Spy/CpxP family protein refolding chaperone